MLRKKISDKETSEYRKSWREITKPKVLLQKEVAPEQKKARRFSKKEYKQKLKDVAEYMRRTNSKIGKASFTILGRYLSKAHKEKVKRYMKNIV
jgi:hypothetical protein